MLLSFNCKKAEDCTLPFHKCNLMLATLLICKSYTYRQEVTFFIRITHCALCSNSFAQIFKKETKVRLLSLLNCQNMNIRVHAPASQHRNDYTEVRVLITFKIINILVCKMVAHHLKSSIYNTKGSPPLKIINLLVCKKVAHHLK